MRSHSDAVKERRGVGERGQEEDELPPDCHGLNNGWEKGRTREIAIGEGVVIGLNWNAEEKVVSLQKRGQGTRERNRAPIHNATRERDRSHGPTKRK